MDFRNTDTISQDRSADTAKEVESGDEAGMVMVMDKADSGSDTLVDATASVTGMPLPVDDWQIDAVSVGLQKCLSGPPGIAPITFNDRVEKIVFLIAKVYRGVLYIIRAVSICWGMCYEFVYFSYVHLH